MSSNSTPIAAVFGVGPGLGLSAARFLGTRGHRVALVSRNATRLAEFTDQLAREGTEATAYPGDITSPAGFDEVNAAIADDLGQIDIALYQVAGPDPSVQSPLEITAENERPYIDQLLLGPLHAVHTLMAPMLERGAGTMLVTLGSSSLGPNPVMSQYAIPQAGLRNHLLGLADEAAPRGVRVGILIIGGLILGSDLQHSWVPEAGPDFPGALDPAELATEFGGLIDGETTPERIVDPYAQGARG